jgi:hypothetical protein
LPDDFNHVVAIALFGFDVNEQGETIPNNFVATAFLSTSGSKVAKNDTEAYVFLR